MLKINSTDRSISFWETMTIIVIHRRPSNRDQGILCSLRLAALAAGVVKLTEETELIGLDQKVRLIKLNELCGISWQISIMGLAPAT